MEVMFGDVVAIRGDLQINNDVRCVYTYDQLFDGRYLKHTGHGGIWIGVVEKIQDTNEGLIALVGGIWRRLDSYEIMYCGSSRTVQA